MTEGQTERAKALASTAGEDPSAVDREAVLSLLGADDAETRRYAARAFVTLDWSPADAAGAVDPLAASLDAEDPLLRDVAVRGLDAVAALDADLVSEHVPAVRALLDDDQELVRDSAVGCLTTVARQDPAAVEPAVPTLLETFDPTDPMGSYDELFCLATVARANPEPFVPVVGQFLAAFADVDTRPGVETTGMDNSLDAERVQDVAANARDRRRKYRIVAGDVLVAVAHFDPDAVHDHLDRIAAHADVPDPGIRGVALDVFAALAPAFPDDVVAHRPVIVDALDAGPSTAGRAVTALAALARERPDAVVEAVEPHVSDLVTRLGGDDREVRSLAAGLLSFVADESPGAVEPALDAVRDCLSDEYAPVRGNAVWVLAAAGDERDRERVAELRDDDPDAEVREAAREALRARADG